MKPYCNDFVIKLRLGEFVSLQSTGKLVGVHRPAPKEAKTHLVTPDTHEQVKQYYIPESLVGTNEPISPVSLFTRYDCETAVIIKDKVTDTTTVTILPKENVDEIHKSDLPKNIMNVTVHTQADADAMMFQMKDTQSYVFYPHLKDPDNVQNYQLLLEVLKRSDLAFCSIVNLQNHEGLFRLRVWRDRIVLVRQGYPDSIVEHAPPTEDEFLMTAPLPDKVVDKAINGFSKMVEPLDPETYRNRILAEKVELKEQVDAGSVETVEVKPVKAAVSSLEDLLAAFGDD